MNPWMKAVAFTLANFLVLGSIAALSIWIVESDRGVYQQSNSREAKP